MITAVTPAVTIILPDGREEVPERRAQAGPYRPYRPEDGGRVHPPAERRRRPRRRDEPWRGRLLDILS
ncbi:MAG TPA: hypothetical protein ENJ83_01020 [Rhodospirillales bacterium]|nr:hypothetical protein [Rhodospirillales bacterium]